MNSLDPSLWASANTVQPASGDQVFKEEKSTVTTLSDLLKKGMTAVQPSITALVGVDRNLALFAINDAAGGDPKELAKASDELAKSDSANSPADQIQHYGNAWQSAIKAVP